MKFVRLMFLVSILLVSACNQDSAEPIEEDTVATEDQLVESLEQENNSVDEESGETTSEPSIESSESIIETFESLPVGTQIALLTPYYDERGDPQNIIDGMFVMYGVEDSFIFLQVHSGAGSGHPVYMIERKGNTFYPVDGVVSMGVSGYEEAPPPQVSVTIDDLMADYERNPDLYDEAATHTEPNKFDLTSFNELKEMVE